MRLWNLSSFEKLETPVLTAQPAFKPSRRVDGPGMHTGSAINIAMRVVALAAVSYSVAVCGSSTVLTIPSVAGVEATCNVDLDRPPLEALFGGRFKGNWTHEKEDQLLSKGARKPVVPDHDFLNLVHTAQHETVSESAPRLSEGDILKLTRRKV